jgi:hypothetical protein
MLDYVGYAHISIVKLLIKPGGLFQICVNPINLDADPNSGTYGGFLNWIPSRHHACFDIRTCEQMWMIWWHLLSKPQICHCYAICGK